MFLLKSKEKSMQFKCKMSKVELIEELLCDEEENLLQVVPTLATGQKGSTSKILKILEIVQNEKEEYSYEEISSFVDDVIASDENMSISKICYKIIEELDTSGIIERGMGLLMVQKMEEGMQEAIQSLKSEMEQAELKDMDLVTTNEEIG